MNSELHRELQGASGASLEGLEVHEKSLTLAIVAFVLSLSS